jgi:hypothetical protein
MTKVGEFGYLIEDYLSAAVFLEKSIKCTDSFKTLVKKFLESELEKRLLSSKLLD